MLCYMHRALDKFGTKLFRLNYLQVIHYVFGWHVSSVKTLIKKMLLGDRTGWGLFLSIGLILLFSSHVSSSCGPLLPLPWGQRENGRGSGCCWGEEHGSRCQTFLRMYSEGMANLLKWKVMEQREGHSAKIHPKGSGAQPQPSLLCEVPCTNAVYPDSVRFTPKKWCSWVYLVMNVLCVLLLFFCFSFLFGKRLFDRDELIIF